MSVAWAVSPRLLDPMTTEEVSGVRGGSWTRLLTGWDAPTNPPVLLWIANAAADGPAVVDVGRAVAFVGTLLAAMGVGWIVGRRGGWSLGLLAGALMGAMPPVVMDGARVRGYGPASALMAVHLGAWLRVVETGQPRDRVLRVLSGGLAVYAHYLTAPLLALQAASFLALEPRARRHARDLLAVPLLWSPTLVWILGDGNDPKSSREALERVAWYVLGFSAKRSPFSVRALAAWWRESWAVLWVPGALIAMGWLRDGRARALQASALLQLVALLGLGAVLLVRAPAATLVLPSVLVALGVGVGTLSRAHALGVAVPVALWSVSGLRHLEGADPFLLQADAPQALAVLSSHDFDGQEVHVPSISEYLRLDLLHHGLPFDDPSREGQVPDCFETSGARVCRGAPAPGGLLFRRTPGGQVPGGCEVVRAGRGWSLLRCQGGG